MIPQHLVFAPEGQVYFADENHILISWDERYEILQGDLAVQVAKGLTTMRPVDELVDKLSSSYQQEHIYYLLNTWLDLELVIEKKVDEGLNTYEHDFFCDNEKIDVFGSDSSVSKKISSAQLNEPESPSDDIYFYYSNSLLDIPPDSVRTLAMEFDVPVLFIVAGRKMDWVGPLWFPGDSWCFECLKRVVKRNRPDLVFLQEKGVTGLKRNQVSEKTRKYLLRELKNVQMEEETFLKSGIVSINRVGPGREYHSTKHLTPCNDCSSRIKKKKFQNVYVGQKIAYQKGGYRTRSASRTLNQYASIIDPLTGIARLIMKAPFKGKDLVHVVQVFQGMREVDITLKYLKGNLYPISGGKGESIEQSNVSGLCEAIERYSMLYQGCESLRECQYSELKAPFYTPAQLLTLSEKQYRERDFWNEEVKSEMHFVPERYSDQMVISWTAGCCANSGKEAYFPTSYCYTGFRGAGDKIAFADSNGVAAGCTYEEAMLQGVLELIERDCTAIWWYNQIKRPLVDFASFKGTWFSGYEEVYASLSREIWVIDITNDLAIPTFVAVSRQIGRGSEHIILGFGCHLSPEIAIGRAISELNQILPGAEEAQKNNYRGQTYDAAAFAEWQKYATTEAFPFLQPNSRPMKGASDYQKDESQTIEEALNLCLEKLDTAGLDTFYLDLTRPEINLPVVKMIVPGLRHFWYRLGKGRLYDVPVNLGWLEKTKHEKELNPIPLSY